MTKIDTIIAPRALTSTEVASVIVPELVAHALAHRAFTHGRLWLEDEHEDATRHAAEHLLDLNRKAALESVLDWAGDMQSGGEPRFYQKHGLEKAVGELCFAAATIACACNSETELNLFTRNLEDRDPDTLAHVIGVAGGDKLDAPASMTPEAPGPEPVFLILTWDISESRIEGPYTSCGDAWSKIEDLPDQFLENNMVLGPIRQARGI